MGVELPDRLAVTLTVTELRELVRSEVEAALAEHAPRAAEREPLLVSGREMCRLLDVSRTTLHRMRLRGCPAVRMGDVYKYQPQNVLAWVIERGETSHLT